VRSSFRTAPGWSRKPDERILKLMFGEMSQALGRGEYVELPFGYLKV